MDLSGTRALVTGADGFIGSHLVERLAGAGAEVTALSLYEAFGRRGWLDNLPAATLARVRLVRGDLRDPAFVRRLAEGCEVIFHLGALIAIPYSYDSAQSYVDVNMSGTLNVLEAARQHRVARLIHTSTSEVYGTAQVSPIAEDHPLHAQSPYAASKIGADMLAESYARSFGLPVVTLRPFNTYGPRQSERAVIPTVIRQALDPACEAIRIGDLTPTRDFNYVGDTVEAFLAVAGADGLDYGRPYNAGTGIAVSIGEMVERVREITGVNKPVESEPERFRPEESEVRALLADAGRLAAATGWRPRVDLDEGLAKTVEWWRGRIKAGALRPGAEYLT